MEAIEVLNVSADAFFKVITQSVLSDIQRQTNKRMHAGQLKRGLHYEKTLKRRFASNSRVKVSVLECIPNRLYSTSYTSKLDVTTVRYEIEILEEDQIRVTYRETYALLNSSETHDHRILKNGLLDKQSDKKGTKLLKQIETYIQDHKEQDVQ